METAKRTYALPSQTLRRFEGKIAPGKRSAKVAELMAATKPLASVVSCFRTTTSVSNVQLARIQRRR